MLANIYYKHERVRYTLKTNKHELYSTYIVIYLAFAVFIMPVRLMGIFNTAYIVLPISLAVSLVISFQYFIINKAKGLSYSDIFIAFYPLFLVPIGLVNEHLPNYIITDTLKPILWVGIIGLFKSVNIDNTSYMKAIYRPVLILSFCSLTTVIFVNYLILTVGGVRASASDITMLFPFFYFFVNKLYLFTILFLLLLIMGGKVGPLLSVLVVLALFYVVRAKPKTILIGSVISCLLFFVLLNFDYEQWRKFLPILSKFRLIFEGGFSINELDAIDKYLLGGRLAEIFGSMSVYKDNFFLLFSGPGVGYTYDLYRDGILEQVNRHGVHFSPISLLTIYGAFYTVVFYGYLSYVFFKSLKIIKKNQSKFQVLAAMFFIANLINSFTVYAIFSVLMFPLSIGLVLNKSNQLNVRS